MRALLSPVNSTTCGFLRQAHAVPAGVRRFGVGGQRGGEGAANLIFVLIFDQIWRKAWSPKTAANNIWPHRRGDGQSSPTMANKAWRLNLIG